MQQRMWRHNVVEIARESHDRGRHISGHNSPAARDLLKPSKSGAQPGEAFASPEDFETFHSNFYIYRNLNKDEILYPNHF